MEMKKNQRWIVSFFVFFTFVLGPMAASAAEKEITRKMILGGRLEDSYFVLSQALANFVNKQSDWLRLDVVATPGASAGAEIASKDYDKYIFISPYLGMRFNPTDKRVNFYDKERIIGLCSANLHLWITFDQNIKTGKDLAGKTVFIGRPGGARTIIENMVLKENGVFDKVKLLHGGFGGGVTALRDGMADVTVTSPDYILPSTFKKGQYIEDLETRKPVYYPHIIPKPLQLKLGMIPVRIRAGALDKKTQPEEVYAAMDPIFWCADARMDDAVVREVTRILYNNTDQFASWHAQGASITKDSVCTWVIKPEQMHPAATKFYQEQGAKVKSLLDILP
jgi:TRAP transporter TAXI family solute receptor